jgi:alpha-aminoadipate/glutamate carrier protein LysW
MMTCPQCDSLLEFDEDEVSEGDKLMCEECGVHLVVSSLDPVELELDDDEYDDEDEDDFDEDDEEEEEAEEEEDDDWR